MKQNLKGKSKFQGVHYATLSNEREQFELMGLEPSERAIAGNPLTKDHTCLRVSILPSLLSTLKANRHRELPQRLFEVGVTVPGEQSKFKLAGVAIQSMASFTVAKSMVEAILEAVDVQYSMEPYHHNSFI